MAAPQNYSPDPILPQPEQAKAILPIQGGGARPRLNANSNPVIGDNGKTVMTNITIESLETDVRGGNANTEPKVPTLVKLEKGFRVRVPDETIKEEIMALDFTSEEQRLFEDFLKFDKAFVKRYIGNTQQSKEDFYEFWKLLIEKDGTDGYTLMTKTEGKKLQSYMENIVYAHRDYLIQSALRLLRKQDNPEHFEDVLSPEEEEGFIFAEVKPREVAMPAPELPKGEVEDDEEDDEDDEDWDEEEEEEEEEDGEEEEDPEEKIKNILTHIHKKIITVSSSDTSDVKVVKLIHYLIEEFEYNDADKDNAKPLLAEYLGCKITRKGTITCQFNINIDYRKILSKTFLETFNNKFNLSKISKMEYEELTEVLRWIIENLYLVSIDKTSAEYREILMSYLVYFYNRFVGLLIDDIKYTLLYISPKKAHTQYLNRDNLPELPEALQPKKKKQAAQDK